jgi:hypothetical protein
MLKNRLDSLEELNQNIAEGSTNIPTELEAIIRKEAMFIVKEKFDHLEGSRELYLLIQMMNKPGQKDKNIL